MPGRYTRRAMDLIDEHANSILFVMAAVLVVVAVFAAVGWSNAQNARERLNTIEAERQAERRASDIQAVATCFETFRGRPRLLTILSAIAAQFDERFARDALDALIEEYDDSSPSRRDCLELAANRDVDPRPFDKPPPG